MNRLLEDAFVGFVTLVLGAIIAFAVIVPVRGAPPQAPRPPQAPSIKEVIEPPDVKPTPKPRPDPCGCSSSCTCGCQETGVCDCATRPASKEAVRTEMAPSYEPACATCVPAAWRVVPSVQLPQQLQSRPYVPPARAYTLLTQQPAYRQPAPALLTEPVRYVPPQQPAWYAPPQWQQPVWYAPRPAAYFPAQQFGAVRGGRGSSC